MKMHQSKSKYQGKILILQWGRGLRVLTSPLKRPLIMINISQKTFNYSHSFNTRSKSSSAIKGLSMLLTMISPQKTHSLAIKSSSSARICSR